MADRWVIYDYDQDELATTNAYASYDEARGDADQLSNVTVVRLIDVAPDADADAEPISEGYDPETCEHAPHEDCLNCMICGQCREDLDSEDVCMDCGGEDESEAG